MITFNCAKNTLIPKRNVRWLPTRAGDMQCKTLLVFVRNEQVQLNFSIFDLKLR